MFRNYRNFVLKTAALAFCLKTSIAAYGEPGGPAAAQDFIRDHLATERPLAWNELTRHAIGSPLNAKAFASEFK